MKTKQFPEIRHSIDKIWLQQQFKEIERFQKIIVKQQDDIDKACKIILSKIQELEAVVGDSGNVTPELEAQVILAQKLSKSIDDKVPDRTTPPGPSPT